MDEAMSHKVGVQDIVPELVQALTQEGGFGWQLKYKVRLPPFATLMQPTSLGKAAKECLTVLLSEKGLPKSIIDLSD